MMIRMVVEVEYITCPFCSRNLHLPKIDPEAMATLEKDPATEWFIYQVREQRGGKGSSRRLDKEKDRLHQKAVGGFFLLPEKSKNIIQMLDDPRLRPYALGIVERLKVILKSYKKAG